MRDRDPKLKAEDLPRVVTIDGSQGDEALDLATEYKRELCAAGQSHHFFPAHVELQ